MTRSRRIDPSGLAEYLRQPRTAAEIAARFKQPGLAASDVRRMSLTEPNRLFEQKNDMGVSIFVTAPQVDQSAVAPREWSVWMQPEDQPYLWIQFPSGMKRKRIKILGISDVHYGARHHEGERFIEYRDWIANTDEAFAYLNGDIIENAVDGSIGGAVYESKLTPDQQIWGDRHLREPGIIELLRPIAHKILWAQPGNHEWRTWKKTNIDPLKIVCRELGIPYYNEPIYADVLAWGHRFTFYCHHGVSGSGTKGGKINAANRPGSFQEAVDFMVMGHVHDSVVKPQTRIERVRAFDDKGRLTGFELRERQQYTIICPSFHGYWNTYGSRAGYAPGSLGSISCMIRADSSYCTSG